MTYAVEFDNVSRLYGDVRAVDGVSIAIKDGEFFSMLGPSGSGKREITEALCGSRGTGTSERTERVGRFLSAR